MPEFSEQSEELAPKPEELKPDKGLAPQPEDTASAEPLPKEKEEIKLLQPSKELAKRLLTRVGFNERLKGYKMSPMQGNMEESIYSFKDAINLLHVDIGDFNVRTTGSIGYIDPVRLERWVGETLGDKELAEVISKKAKEGNSYKERVETIRPMMEQRLKQCREIIGEETES